MLKNTYRCQRGQVLFRLSPVSGQTGPQDDRQREEAKCRLTFVLGLCSLLLQQGLGMPLCTENRRNQKPSTKEAEIESH